MSRRLLADAVAWVAAVPLGLTGYVAGWWHARQQRRAWRRVRAEMARRGWPVDEYTDAQLKRQVHFIWDIDDADDGLPDWRQWWR